jgi:hypothetical protein
MRLESTVEELIKESEQEVSFGLHWKEKLREVTIRVCKKHNPEMYGYPRELGPTAPWREEDIEAVMVKILIKILKTNEHKKISAFAKLDPQMKTINGLMRRQVIYGLHDQRIETVDDRTVERMRLALINNHGVELSNETLLDDHDPHFRSQVELLTGIFGECRQKWRTTDRNRKGEPFTRNPSVFSQEDINEAAKKIVALDPRPSFREMRRGISAVLPNRPGTQAHLYSIYGTGVPFSENFDYQEDEDWEAQAFTAGAIDEAPIYIEGPEGEDLGEQGAREPALVDSTQGDQPIFMPEFDYLESLEPEEAETLGNLAFDILDAFSEEQENCLDLMLEPQFPHLDERSQADALGLTDPTLVRPLMKSVQEIFSRTIHEASLSESSQLKLLAICRSIHGRKMHQLPGVPNK